MKAPTENGYYWVRFRDDTGWQPCELCDGYNEGNYPLIARIASKGVAMLNNPFHMGNYPNSACNRSMI